MRYFITFRRLLAALALFTVTGLAAADYQSHRQLGNQLLLTTSDGELAITFFQPQVAEVHYQSAGVKQLPSFAIGTSPAPLTLTLADNGDHLLYRSADMRIKIAKSPLKLSFYKGEQLITEEQPGFVSSSEQLGFKFRLTEQEKLFGAGQRVLGMDRRGHRLPLYNKAHYGYSTESEQMYFSLAGVMSSNKYMLLFDNSASGHIDLGKTDAEILEFSAVGGRSAYIVVAGDSFPELINNYLTVSGKPPLPARWTLGSYASRFGYRNEAEARAVVQKYRELGLPLDAIVLDLYWFGPDIKGHVGNLAWDREAFPQPEKMLADFKADGVNTILVTEPFVLTSSKRWQQAVAADVLAKAPDGSPKTFDFYFGNTGLIDVFNPVAADWFWQIYKDLAEQGVAGVWGDLGEPEVHPSDTIHMPGSADEIHNAYGHRWAELVYRGYKRNFADTRPFIMMRAGSLGSQRYGMVPWTGDVDRSWGGLQPQVELALQMSLFGFGYIHSDLGGFAGGETFDPELYIRWLQYGVFQPVYRPHAQEHIAPEPVFHSQQVIDTLRPYLNLRYQLLPYLYTMAWQHSQTGMPLMRPLFFLDETNTDFMDETNSYLWGDAFLVAPVTKPGVRSWPVNMPEGVWFDFFSDKRYQGGELTEVPVSIDTIPVLVKAGSFVPMVEPMASTKNYSSQKLTVHYYADSSVSCSKGQMYEDDGSSTNSIENGNYELLNFYALDSTAENASAHGGDSDENGLKLEFSRSAAENGGDYSGNPESRELTVVLHNQSAKAGRITVNGQFIAIVAQPQRFARQQNVAYYDKASKQLKIKTHWQGEKLQLQVR